MIKFLDPSHKLFSINPGLRARFEEAQADLLHNRFKDATALCKAACDAIQTKDVYATALAGQPLFPFADLSKAELLDLFGQTADRLKVPVESRRDLLCPLVSRVQLLRAFADPEKVIRFTTDKIAEVVGKFPQTKANLERGSNPGDVLDPYIMTAARYLLYQQRITSTMEGAAAHKALMMIEDLIGHLHEDVIGQMRGNVRVPEPRGKKQATLDLQGNPFPGADLAQPPRSEGGKLRLFQVKNKTGSAKGGDGTRLGKQLRRLRTTYDAETFYAALVGNTLRGHRSMTAVLKASPSTVALVGQAAFKELTGSPNGAELLLSVYQNAFIRVAEETGYDIARAAREIAAQFEQAEAAQGEDFSSLLLHDTINGPPEFQDSRLYRASEPARKKKRAKRRKKKAKAPRARPD